MAETKNIVFLGASYAGLGASHYLLKHVYNQLPTDPKVQYKAILVDASSKFFMRTVSPRAVMLPEQAPAEKILVDIEPGFKQYGDKVSFVHAKATAWDERTRTVTLESGAGQQQTLSYWALILATGSRTQLAIYSLQGSTHEETAEKLRSVNAEIRSAKSIVISGGGPASVETAGEIGEALNGAAGWFSSRPANPKVKVTVVTSSSELLPMLRQSLSNQAETYLHRVGVDVRYNTKIYSAETHDGKTTVMLHDGEEIGTDLYIPATGVEPLSAYVPPHLKDSKGYVVQNNSTLRVDAAGPRVYAVGDVGTYSDNGIFAILNSVPVLGANLKRDLLAMHADPAGKPQGEDRLYTQATKEMQIVPVGPSKGVGAIFGWRVPSIFVWLIKGRDYMISKGQDNVDGTSWAKES